MNFADATDEMTKNEQFKSRLKVRKVGENYTRLKIALGLKLIIVRIKGKIPNS